MVRKSWFSLPDGWFGEEISIFLTRWDLVRKSWYSFPDGWFGKEILIFLTRQPSWWGNLDFPHQMGLGKEILIFLTRRPVWQGNLDFAYQMGGSVRKLRFPLTHSLRTIMRIMNQHATVARLSFWSFWRLFGMDVEDTGIFLMRIPSVFCHIHRQGVVW